MDCFCLDTKCRDQSESGNRGGKSFSAVMLYSPFFFSFEVDGVGLFGLGV